MVETLRLMFLLLIGGMVLLLSATVFLRLNDPINRLKHKMSAIFDGRAHTYLIDMSGLCAVGIDAQKEDVALLWDIGQNGLVFSFEEIDGAEIIIDGKVMARALKGEQRRVLEDHHNDAHDVVLRFLFNDVEKPDFEIVLLSAQTSMVRISLSPAEAVKISRRWLSHIDAIIRKFPIDLDPYKPQFTPPVRPPQTQQPPQIPASPAAFETQDPMESAKESFESLEMEHEKAQDQWDDEQKTKRRA